MKQGLALFVALVMGVDIVLTLMKGRAAAGEGLLRGAEPFGFWGNLVSASAVLLAMLCMAWDA